MLSVLFSTNPVAAKKYCCTMYGAEVVLYGETEMDRNSLLGPHSFIFAQQSISFMRMSLIYKIDGI